VNDTPAESTVGRIVAATLALMVEHGLNGITMTAVADSAGVARQTLYNHFPDVESIVAASVETHQGESIDALRRVLGTISEAAARLEHLVRHLGAAAVHHAPMPAIHDSLSAPVRESLLVHERALRSIIAETLRDGVAAGAFRTDLDVERDTVLIHRMLQGVTELVAIDPDAVTDVVATTTRTLVAAVARPGSRDRRE